MDRNVFPAIGAIGLFTARGGGGGVYCPPPSANLSSAPGDAALGQYLRMGHGTRSLPSAAGPMPFLESSRK